MHRHKTQHNTFSSLSPGLYLVTLLQSNQITNLTYNSIHQRNLDKETVPFKKKLILCIPILFTIESYFGIVLFPMGENL